MRAYQDLRAFLRVLEEEHQLLRVTEEVLPEPDLGAAARVGVGHGDASGKGVAVFVLRVGFALVLRVGLRLSCAKGGGCPIARKQEKAVKRAETNA
jgi:hypothetical protein